MDDQEPAAAKPRSRTRLVLQVAVSLVLVVAIFYCLLRGIDLAEVWAEIRAMTWLEDAILVVIALWNLATYALVWMAVTPGLGFWRAMAMTEATSAVTNTVPTVGPAIGIGLTYSMLGSWGYSRSKTTVAVLVSGVWNAFVKLGLPVLALALVALQGGDSGGRVVAALLGSPAWRPQSWCSRCCCAARSWRIGSRCWPGGSPRGGWAWSGGRRWWVGSWPR